MFDYRNSFIKMLLKIFFLVLLASYAFPKPQYSTFNDDEEMMTDDSSALGSGTSEQFLEEGDNCQEMMNSCKKGLICAKERDEITVSFSLML